jgi:hypothetical protein
MNTLTGLLLHSQEAPPLACLNLDIEGIQWEAVLLTPTGFTPGQSLQMHFPPLALHLESQPSPHHLPLKITALAAGPLLTALTLVTPGGQGVTAWLTPVHNTRLQPQCGQPLWGWVAPSDLLLEAAP